jgi:hypothetical protein
METVSVLMFCSLFIVHVRRKDDFLICLAISNFSRKRGPCRLLWWQRYFSEFVTRWWGLVLGHFPDNGLWYRLHPYVERPASRGGLHFVAPGNKSGSSDWFHWIGRYDQLLVNLVLKFTFDEMSVLLLRAKTLTSSYPRSPTSHFWSGTNE